MCGGRGVYGKNIAIKLRRKPTGTKNIKNHVCGLKTEIVRDRSLRSCQSCLGKQRLPRTISTYDYHVTTKNNCVIGITLDKEYKKIENPTSVVYKGILRDRSNHEEKYGIIRFNECLKISKILIMKYT